MDENILRKIVNASLIIQKGRTPKKYYLVYVGIKLEDNQYKGKMYTISSKDSEEEVVKNVIKIMKTDNLSVIAPYLQIPEEYKQFLEFN